MDRSGCARCARWRGLLGSNMRWRRLLDQALPTSSLGHQGGKGLGQKEGWMRARARGRVRVNSYGSLLLVSCVPWFRGDCP